jgi:hypothetical protein
MGESDRQDLLLISRQSLLAEEPGQNRSVDKGMNKT